MVKSSGQGVLSSERLHKASKTSSYEKGTSKLLDLSVPKTWNCKSLIRSLQSAFSNNKVR